MKKGNGRVVLVVGVVLVVAIIVFHEYLLAGLGHFLVLKQQPSKADYIVILNGRPTERCLAAVDLYQKNLGSVIIMACLGKQPGSDEFWHRVGKNFQRKAFPQRALEALGVPEKALRFIGDGVASTYDEAKVAQAFVREHGGRTIIIVTSKWHSRRTYLTFKSVFKHQKVSISIYPSPYDTFNPDDWWKNESDIELVFREYLRLLYYVLTFRISFFP